MDYGKRLDGTAKGSGYFGELKRTDDPKAISTELSADASIKVNGKRQDILFPLLVPTLTRSEIDNLLAGKKPTDAIYQKAIDHAVMRISDGKSPFAAEGEQGALPPTEEQDMQAGYNQ